MTWGQHLDTRTRIVDSNHGHERPVRELRVLLWDILCVLVDISTRTPYCSTVCLCVSVSVSQTLNNHVNNSLTHSKSYRQPGERDNPVPAKATPGLTSRWVGGKTQLSSESETRLSLSPCMSHHGSRKYSTTAGACNLSRVSGGLIT